MQFFTGLKNSKEIEKVFSPVLVGLEKTNLLNDTDKISIRFLLEKVDDYFLKLKEKIRYFKNVRPKIVEFDKNILQLQIDQVKEILAVENLDPKKRLNAKMKLLNLEKEFFVLSESVNFESFDLRADGTIFTFPAFDTTTIMRDLLTMLKENSLTNIVRTRMLHTFKLGSAQKSISSLLTEMVTKEFKAKNVS